MAGNTPPGPAVDASGQTVIDPTKNVDQLVASAIQRQDDLREMEARHIRELDAMRDRHADAMRKSESARLDAIRSVDITAVQRAAEVSEIRASTLASQVSDSANALRITVEQAALQQRTSQAQALEPIQKDIADLRRVQYEAAGSKTQVVETRGETQAKGNSQGMWIGIAISVVTIIVTILVAVASITVIIMTRTP